MNNKNTSWGNVAGWYDSLLEKESSNYQKDLILPNLLRIVAPKKGDKLIDIACGQGMFTREFWKAGAWVVGADISKNLIEIAISYLEKEKIRGKGIDFIAAPADKLKSIPDASFDKATIVLALQNIDNLNDTMEEAARVLKPGGKLFIVMNHPAFRIPQHSSWDWDLKNKARPSEERGSTEHASANVQYRRIDEYMTESRTDIKMHPGEKPKEVTISFHRPLQVYFKAMRKAGLAVINMEEWVSNRKSEPGPRASAENKARMEIPLFLMMEAIKLSK